MTKPPAPALPKLLSWAVWGLIAAYVGLVIFAAHLNHDVAWIAYSARELLHGAQFGRDVVDVNPPLAWWLSTPAVLLSEATSAGLAISVRAYLLLLTALGLFMLKNSDRSISTLQLAFVACVLVVMPGYDFGQRENLMVMLVAPYLATALTTGAALSRPLKIGTGFMAGIGICLKPYFLLLPIAVEATGWLLHGRLRGGVLRTQTLVMGMVGIVYVAAALVMAPAYFAQVIPVAMTSYSVYNNPPFMVLSALVTRSLQALLAFAATIYARVRWGNALAFIVASAASAVVVMVQSKGWNYHIYPVAAFLVIAVVLVSNRVQNRPAYRVAQVFATLAVLTPAAIHSWDTWSPRGEQATITALAERMQQVENGRTVYAFILSPRIVWPAIVSAGARSSDSTCCAYLVPAAVNAPQDAQAVKNAEEFLTRLLNRLTRENPQMIFIDTRKQLIAIKQPGFTFESYLSTHHGWSRFLSHYSPTKPVAHYKVLVRN